MLLMLLFTYLPPALLPRSTRAIRRKSLYHLACFMRDCERESFMILCSSFRQYR